MEIFPAWLKSGSKLEWAWNETRTALIMYRSICSRCQKVNEGENEERRSGRLKRMRDVGVAINDEYEMGDKDEGQMSIYVAQQG